MASLSTSLKLGPLTLPTRNIMSSLTRNRAVPTTIPNQVMAEYYTQRAKGGAGLILSEGTLICHQGTEWPHAPGIWSKEHVEGWKPILDAVHKEGVPMFCQLWHTGRIAHPDAPEQLAAGKPVPAPSAIAARGEGKFRFLPGNPGFVTPTPLADPTEIIKDYRVAAEFAKEAGFDGVELHSANGYLVHQFLDSTSNKRTDAWGGSVENRCRFGLEALKAIIDVWGSDRVGIKISPAGGYNDMGMPLDETIETFTHYIQEIMKLQLAYIQVLQYIPSQNPEYDGKPRATQHDILSTYGHLIKPSPATKFLLNGGLTAESANALLKQDKIDAAVFGIPWIANPDLQKRFEQGVELSQPLWQYAYGGAEGKPWVGYSDYPVKAKVE